MKKTLNRHEENIADIMADFRLLAEDSNGYITPEDAEAAIVEVSSCGAALVSIQAKSCRDCLVKENKRRFEELRREAVKELLNQ